jgi:adenylate cyclase
MKQSFWKKLLAGVIIGISTGLLVWLLSEVVFKPFFFRIEAQTYDWRMRRAVTPLENPVDEIVIVDVDERSVQKLGSYYHWPRERWTKLINFLSGAGVSMIGLDFIFDPDLRHPAEENEFQQAMRNAGMVCNALYLSQADPDNFRPVMAREPSELEYQKFIYQVPKSLYDILIPEERIEPENASFLNSGLTAGYVNLFPDPDGVLRRIPVFMRFNENVYAAFSVQIALNLLGIKTVDYDPASDKLNLQNDEGKEYKIPIDKHGQMLIHYIGGFKSFRYVSFYDALMGFLPAEFFKGKIVLVGSSLPGFYDLRTTPLQPAFPGVEVNANVIYQILHQTFIYQLSGWQIFLFLLIFALIIGVILIFPRPVGSIVTSIILIFLTILMAQLALQNFYYWIPFIAPVFIIIITFAITYMYRYLFEEKDKRQIRKIFSHYVSPSVVDVMLKNPEKVKLGGERKSCTVLFSDIVGFTTLSEQMEPEKLVTLLNDYFTSMTNVIIQNKGLLDKYEGDAVMAVFGAPIEMENNAELACTAALQMQFQLQQLHTYWQKTGRPELPTRIGINSGEMVAGNMGSETRFNYTVLGDSVNLASRLESVNKVYGTRIIIGENTYDRVQENFVTRPLDLIRVKGKNKPVRIYELLGFKDDKTSGQSNEMILEYKRGFKNYLLRDWDQAISNFEKALMLNTDDGPSKLYLERCREFKNNPPASDWDGVYSMKTK